jgi:hypothetical protein
MTASTAISRWEGLVNFKRRRVVTGHDQQGRAVAKPVTAGGKPLLAAG